MLHLRPVIQIDDFGFLINARHICRPLRWRDLDSILCERHRLVEPPIPAPTGYRNPQFLVYDGLGVVAHSSHIDGCIADINIVFDVRRFVLTAIPEAPFSGSLCIGGAGLDPETTEDDIRDSALPLERFLNIYKAQIFGSYITFEFEGRRQHPPRPNSMKTLVSVSIAVPKI